MKSTREAAKRKNLVGARIRKIRLGMKKPLTQEDLAGKVAALGVLLDRSAISRIESQDRYVMDYEAVAIAKALKVPVADLFGE